MSDDRFASYNQQRRPEPIHGDHGPERPRIEHVRSDVGAAIQSLRRKRGITGDLPPPWPPTVSAAIDFFLTVICSPEKKDERPHLVPTRGSEGYRWEWGYQLRVRATFVSFVNLTQTEQMRIVAGCEAGYEWRGESVEQFERIARETVKMRRQGLGKYLKAAAPEVDKLKEQQVSPNAK